MQDAVPTAGFHCRNWAWVMPFAVSIDSQVSPLLFGQPLSQQPLTQPGRGGIVNTHGPTSHNLAHSAVMPS